MARNASSGLTCKNLIEARLCCFRAPAWEVFGCGIDKVDVDCFDIHLDVVGKLNLFGNKFTRQAPLVVVINSVKIEASSKFCSMNFKVFFILHSLIALVE